METAAVPVLTLMNVPEAVSYCPTVLGHSIPLLSPDLVPGRLCHRVVPLV